MFRLLLCALLLVSPAFGAKELTPEEIGLKLKAYESLSAFKTKFRQVKRIRKMNLDLQSEGELTVQRPNRVVWKIVRPAPLTLTLTAREITLIQGEGDSKREEHWKVGAQISEQTARGIHQLVAWLQLDAKQIAASYRLLEEKPNEFLCLPKKEDTGSPFKSFRLILGKSGHLEKLTLEERSNDSVSIQFSPPSPL